MFPNSGKNWQHWGIPSFPDRLKLSWLQGFHATFERCLKVLTMGIKVFGQSSFITPLGIGPATPHYPIKSNLRLSTYPFLDHIIFCLQATQGGEESLLIFSHNTSVCVVFVRSFYSKDSHQMQMQRLNSRSAKPDAKSSCLTQVRQGDACDKHRVSIAVNPQ